MADGNVIKLTDIAVIIPIYNAGKTLKPCIRSILKQTFKNFNLILVDDGSTDKSGKVCDRFAEEDSRITVIHQKNKGSVEARKTGILSEKAQRSKYVFISDADDTLPEDAIETLYNLAERHNADCVCGNMQKMWKGVCFKAGYKAPCFNIDEEKSYLHEEIIEKLYIGCFGVSDFPVNLVAKLYRTELITKACDFPPVVKFMGDDLSVTLRVIPDTQKLVITPKIVYNYRLGGGTSKFMPYMLDDFLALYEYKRVFSGMYPMPYDVPKLMNIELMNVVRSYLYMCAADGKFTQDKLSEKIDSIFENDIICQAAESLCNNASKHEMAAAISARNRSAILENINAYVKSMRLRRMAKKILMLL